MQLIHALFSVPQISMKMSDLSPDHLQMLRTYLKFWREHCELLLQGDLQPLYPHLLYPLVVARHGTRQLAAFYGPLALVCESSPPSTLILVNGAYKSELIIDARGDMGDFSMVTVDCMGETTSRGAIRLVKGLHQVPVPPAGHAILTKQ